MSIFIGFARRTPSKDLLLHSLPFLNIFNLFKQSFAAVPDAGIARHPIVSRFVAKAQISL